MFCTPNGRGLDLTHLFHEPMNSINIRMNTSQGHQPFFSTSQEELKLVYPKWP